MSYMSTVRSGPRLKQSTATTVKVQIYADDARLPYPGDASTVTVTFAKGGAAAMTGSSAPTLANDGNGMFQLAFAIGNLDTTGPLYVRMTATGADDAWYEFYVTADDPAVAKATAADLATAQTGITEIASDTDSIITTAATLATSAALATAQTAITEIAVDTDSIITTVATLSTSSSLATVQTSITEIAADTDTIITNVAGVQADTDDIQTRLPAALVGGRMDASVGAMTTDSLSAASVAAAAVTKIQSGLSTSSAVAGVQADTDDIQSRLPTTLVGGRMDSSVGAMANNTITAAAVATDAVTEIQNGLATASEVASIQSDTDNIQTRLPAILVGGKMDSSVSSIGGDVGAQISRIEAAQLGRWKVENNQLTLYDLDGTTPLVVFNLFDQTGSPSMTKIFERVPV